MICKADVCLRTIIIYISVFCKQLMVRRYIVSSIPDSDPDLASSSLVAFGPNFDCILLHIQKFYMETYDFVNN
jgi:hypothetical protein